MTLSSRTQGSLSDGQMWLTATHTRWDQLTEAASRTRTPLAPWPSKLLAFPALRALSAVLEQDPGRDVLLLDVHRGRIERRPGPASALPPVQAHLNLRATPQRAPLPDVPDATVIHPQLGLILGFLIEGENSIEPMVHAQLACAHTGQRVLSTGRDHSFLHARIKAVLEALERDAGLTHQSNAPTVQAPMHGLSGAVNPANLGLYRPEQYRQEGFPFQPFDSQRPCQWVGGHHALTGTPSWLEHSFCFYGLPPGPPPLVAGNSSGCAVGSNLEEALFHAMLENLERHAALKWWCSDSSPPRHQGPLDRQTLLLIDAAEHQGATVQLYNISQDLPVPVVLCAVHNGKQLVLTTGAGFDPQKAAQQALSEGMGLWGIAQQFSAAEQARVQELTLHPERVRTVDEHLKAHFEASPALWERLEAAPPQPWPAPIPDLHTLLLRLQQQGTEVHWVDQTTPILHQWNLRCVRAVMPGLMPMHYGAHLQRLHPLARPDRAVHPFT